MHALHSGVGNETMVKALHYNYSHLKLGILELNLKTN